MKIKVDVSGLEHFKKELENFRIDVLMEDATKKASLILHSEISNLTPVDTGVLRNAWIIGNVVREANVYEVTLSNNINYAWYVNYGHRLRNGKWWEGLHFVETGEQQSKDSIFNVIKQTIETYLKKVNGVD